MDSQQNSKTAWYVGAAIALVVAVAAVVAITAGGDDEKKVPVEAGIEQVRPITVAGPPLPEFPSDGADPAIGGEAPILTGQSFDGAARTTRSDSPRLLVFFAHWCPHCQREVPVLVSWEADGNVPEGLEVIGISTGVRADAPNYPPSAWLEKEKFPWPVIADDADQAGGTAMGLTSYPYFVLLDADGNVAWRSTGEVDPDDLTSAITAALGI